MISDEAVDHVVIGRHILDHIGCNNRKILEAACNENNGVYEMKNAEEAQTQDTQTVASLVQNGVFHNSGSFEDDGISDDIFVDLGEDSEEALRAELYKQVEEARKNGMSEKGVNVLK